MCIYIYIYIYICVYIYIYICVSYIFSPVSLGSGACPTPPITFPGMGGGIAAGAGFSALANAANRLFQKPCFESQTPDSGEQQCKSRT